MCYGRTFIHLNKKTDISNFVSDDLDESLMEAHGILLLYTNRMNDPICYELQTIENIELILLNCISLTQQPFQMLITFS